MALPGGCWPLREAGLSTLGYGYHPDLTRRRNARQPGLALSLSLTGSNARTVSQYSPLAGRAEYVWGYLSDMGLFLTLGQPLRFEAREGYTNWCAIAAFFDGDGGLDVSPQSFTLHWSLSFVDNWPPQLLQIKSFLERHGIQVNKPRRSGHGGWKIQISSFESMKEVSRQMLDTRCLVKKRGEVEIMLQYFEGKITGTEVGNFFNNEVRLGKRTGKIRRFDVPFTYQQGKSESRKGLSYHRASLSPTQKGSIARIYITKGRTIYQLASMYHVSPSTIYRVVRGLRRGGI